MKHNELHKPPEAAEKEPRFVPRPLVWAVAAVLLIAVVAAVAALYLGDDNHAQAAVAPMRLEDIPFNGAQAYEYLKQLCEIGPRPSGSEGMLQQQKLLEAHFTKLGAKVDYQRFRTRHPLNGEPVEMANIVVQWHPEAKKRILLCAHYDTLPFPLRDRRNPRGRFVGANDNASGVAVLMELGNEMAKLKLDYGVDFVFFDAEEFMFREDGRFFIGSEFFATDYVRNPPAHKYRWGVLLDMVGDKDLSLAQERNSVDWRDTKPLVDQVWGVARRLGVREFVARKGQKVDDDHLMLRNIAKIPCIDIIDFEYPAWHTENDVPEQCSALSLAKVGWVLREWMKEAK